MYESNKNKNNSFLFKKEELIWSRLIINSLGMLSVLYSHVECARYGEFTCDAHSLARC